MPWSKTNLNSFMKNKAKWKDCSRLQGQKIHREDIWGTTGEIYI